MTGKIINKNINTSKVENGYEEDLSCTDPNYVHVWADGGGNCGPVAIGVVVVEKGMVYLTHGEYLGEHKTNNIAELTAILRGLQLVKNKCKPVKLYSDSRYSLHSVVGNFHGRKNRELIDRIMNYIKEYPVEITFVKVKGHSKLQFNEMADSIAAWFLQHVATEKRFGKSKRTFKRTKKSVGLGSIEAEEDNTNEPKYPRQVMPKIKGKSFRCECGCNVFTEYTPLHYKCNACNAKYKGDPTNAHL